MEKQTYEALKVIRTKVATGQTITFAERNWMAIIEKKEKRKRKNNAK